jgi:transcription elongation factor SPT6
VTLLFQLDVCCHHPCLQILEEAVGAFPELETASGEAEWIFDHAFGPLAVPMHSEFQYLLKMDKAEIVKQIANVLLMVHDEKLELPFIGMYRREECLDLLGEPDINDMDDKPKIRYHEVCSVCCSTFFCLN